MTPCLYTRPPECPKILLEKRTWYQARRHICAKARLRNPERVCKPWFPNRGSRFVTKQRFRARSTTTRDRNLQFRGAVSTGGSPLEALHWIFCFFSSLYVQFSKTSPLKSGECSEKSSGENRVKSCHVCGCHGFCSALKG